MGFYNDDWIIVNMDQVEILLLRKSTNDILLDRIKKDTNISTKESIVRNILEEYDCAIGPKQELYIIYQNKEMDLLLTVLDGEDKKEIKLTSEAIPEVIDLNIMLEDNKIHIVYLVKMEEEFKYRIYHNYYDGRDWRTFIVEEIVAKKVLNPIKLIKDEDGLILTYYKDDFEIEIKKFNLGIMKWSLAFDLVKNRNEKLYLDMIKYEDKIHLIYCEFQEGNLLIKYENFIDTNNGYKKEEETSISNEESINNPTIILYEDDLWVTWVESDKVMSRVSKDYGTSWSESIYGWNNSRTIDFVRYKYLSLIPEKNNIIDYSFGSVYPEMEFIGFGPLENANEIPLKNKPIKMPRI